LVISQQPMKGVMFATGIDNPFKADI